MNLSDIPAKFNIPFGNDAGAGYIRTIPQSPTGTAGQASLETGFPPENFTPVSAGGVPPFGSDFNGILNQSTAWNRWQGTGAWPPYDATYQTAIGGYPQYATVSSLISFGTLYMSIVDANLTNPDTGGAGWITFWRQLISNTDLYVNASTGNDSNSGLSPAAAKKTIQAAVLTAWSFTPSSSFGVTIHVAAGTYNEAVTIPNFSGPNLTIDGGTASTTIVNAGSLGNTFTVQGPNTVTIQNVTVQTSGTRLQGFTAIGGATLITNATISNSISGFIFAAGSGANLTPGTHTVSGSALALFFAQTAGSINPNNSTNYTFSAAVSMSTATAYTLLNGSINLPISAPITFTNPGNVTGSRYRADGCGVILASGLGTSFFPGSSAGTTSFGGQYMN